MADYSEFPTTPTGWQERQAQEWETVTPLATEDAAPPQRRRRPRRPDPGPGLHRPGDRADDRGGPAGGLWRNGGLVWILLIGGGVALLVSELRKARRRRH